ncbi:plasmid recombination protein [Enterococcus hirae]|nr:plasmid recombination protein [Enterococcus hirae]
MAHVQKFTKGAVGGLSIHIERKTLNHSNKDIDVDRTEKNYDLCDKDGDMNTRLSERLDEVHCLNRADVKVMADWVVTLPEELKETSEEVQKRFFEETYDFLADRYGEKNVLAGVVHNDEKTPHMHFSFVPVTFDEKKQREKVSAKLVLNRKDLQTFHQDLDRHLKGKIPEIYQGGILNDKTIGIDDVQTLKKHSEEIKKMEKQLTVTKKQLNQSIKQANSLKGKMENIHDTQKQMIDFENKLSRTLTGKRVVSKEDFQKLRQFVVGVEKKAAKTLQENNKLERKNEQLAERVGKLEKENQQVAKRRDELISEKKDLEGRFDGVRDDSRVFEDKLKELGHDPSEMPEIEYEGRLVMSKLERGIKPKNKKVAEEWLDTLKENKKKGLIQGNRLEQFIEQLKAMIDSFLSKIKGLAR